ncbi:hypothetical protein M408DRAFT_330104 [Serendipita vermifera MAFF 305830]|uniref:DGQHR domain-containing protein n=1 Tax=Serendipita vermifera MAFF 305830 TaxID=933852 RepID=A0A0C3AS88_SERVB|nr:hypothetical protein M408DRAFT_330104 [Serendipita vermifera MAFF 305830]
MKRQRRANNNNDGNERQLRPKRGAQHVRNDDGRHSTSAPPTTTEDKSPGIAEDVERYFIARLQISIRQMRPLRHLRKLDPTHVDRILQRMIDATTYDERFMRPIKVAVDSNDAAVIEAIRNKEDMSSDAWKHIGFRIVDGQHRHEAAVKFADEQPSKDGGHEYWFCDVYEQDIKYFESITTLAVSLNDPGPNKASVAADYVRAFERTMYLSGGTDIKDLFGKRELSTMLFTLYKSRFWQEFFLWVTMPFNQYAASTVLESWYYFQLEYEILRYLIEDSTRQIRVLSKAKRDTRHPLMTADISEKEWTLKTTQKTGTRKAIEYHYLRVSESRSTFRLDDEPGETKFEKFWGLATRGNYIFGEMLWISSDLDVSRWKSHTGTGSPVTGLVIPLRGALSILAVLLFGRQFRLNPKGNKPWIETMMKQIGLEWDWGKCKTIIRVLVDYLDVIKPMLPVRPLRAKDVFIHIEAKESGIQAAMKWLTWSENAFHAWSDILKVCKKVLGVEKNPEVWHLVTSIVFGHSSPTPLPPSPAPPDPVDTNQGGDVEGVPPEGGSTTLEGGNGAGALANEGDESHNVAPEQPPPPTTTGEKATAALSSAASGRHTMDLAQDGANGTQPTTDGKEGAAADEGHGEDRGGAGPDGATGGTGDEDRMEGVDSSENSPTLPMPSSEPTASPVKTGAHASKGMPTSKQLFHTPLKGSTIGIQVTPSTDFSPGTGSGSSHAGFSPQSTPGGAHYR